MVRIIDFVTRLRLNQLSAVKMRRPKRERGRQFICTFGGQEPPHTTGMNHAGEHDALLHLSLLHKQNSWSAAPSRARENYRSRWSRCYLVVSQSGLKRASGCCGRNAVLGTNDRSPASQERTWTGQRDGEALAREPSGAPFAAQQSGGRLGERGAEESAQRQIGQGW